MNTNVDRDTWRQRVQNLIDRRQTGVQDNRKCETIVADYARHLRSFELGKSLLDVGCGDMSIKRLLEANHPGVEYLGIDAFPIDQSVTRMEIEDDEDVKVMYQMYGQFDNVICFAVLDGSYDLVKATNNMKRLAAKSVVILTGIDIEPDEFHTFKITQAGLDELMLADGWTKHMSNYLTPQVLLVEYRPPADRNVEELFKIEEPVINQEPPVDLDAAGDNKDFPEHPKWATMSNPLPPPPPKQNAGENLKEALDIVEKIEEIVNEKPEDKTKKE